MNQDNCQFIIRYAVIEIEGNGYTNFTLTIFTSLLYYYINFVECNFPSRPRFKKNLFTFFGV